MKTNPLCVLASHGQSVWLDYLDGIRKFIEPHEATLAALRVHVTATSRLRP